MFEVRDNDFNNEDDPESEEARDSSDDVEIEFAEEEEELELDWGRDVDDLDPEYWDDHYGGPDEDWGDEDQGLNRFFEGEHELKEEFVRDPRRYTSSGPMETRRSAIVQWLSKSAFARPLAGRPWIGFLIEGGRMGTLRSGEKVEIVSWLLREGVSQPHHVGGYQVTYHPASDGSAAWMKFMLPYSQKTSP